MSDHSLRKHLLYLLEGGGAHLHFDATIKGLPVALRGKRPKGAAHSSWEILEHMRIAQSDILDFCRNPKYAERKWPDDYWPPTPAPPNSRAWNQSVRAFLADLDAMCKLVADPSTDLFTKIPHGDGQTLLREVLLLADHNSYHLGEIVVVRRILGAM